MHELTIQSEKANILAVAFLFPFVIITGLPFYFLWHDAINFNTEIQILREDIFYLLLLSLVFMAIHELLHALAYLLLTKGDFRNIKFGIIWKNLTPYCHYKRPVKIWQYRIAVVTPGIITGVIPLIISMFNGSVSVFLLGLFFSLGALGDFMILWLIRNESANTIVQDHPEKIGCVIYNSSRELNPKNDF